MGFYDHQKNIDQYIAIADGYDGTEIIAVLRSHLPPRSTVLELGSGPGKDLALLNAHYRACGSDASALFMEYCRAHHPDSDLLLLDARTIETDRQFDAIYSNKVLHHLRPAELHQSFARQRQVATHDGILLHSFWHGSGSGMISGSYHHYYTEHDLRMIAAEYFTVIAIQRYSELADDDSLYIVLRNDLRNDR